MSAGHPEARTTTVRREALVRHGVTDPRVLDALLRVPRAAFLAPEFVLDAGEDRTFPGGPSGDYVAPAAFGRMLTALGPVDGHRALDVGSGHGYGAAVLAQLGAHAEAAVPDDGRTECLRRYARLGLGLEVRSLDPTRWTDDAHFDRIVVATPGASVPAALLERLSEGGVLVAAVATGDGAAVALVRVERRGGEFHESTVGPLPRSLRLGDLLVEAGAVSRADVEATARDARAHLGQALLERGVVLETELYRALAAQVGVRYVGADSLLPGLDPKVARSVPRAFVEARRMFPIRIDGDVLIVASVDPLARVDELVKATPAQRGQLHLVTPTDFQRLRTALELGGKPKLLADVPTGDDLLARHPLDDAHLVGLLDAILLEAIGERASDIHLERYGPRVRVRLRVDGDLRDVEHLTLTPIELAGVVNVLKVAANLDISERRLPQGGRFRRRAGEHVFDLRVQTQPSLHGEHVVVRLLPQTVQLLTIEELGFDPDTASVVRRLLDSPAGLVLVVGPTGSGKSTTLYAALQVLARDTTRKVLTIEDPIEYALENVQQSQVLPEIGFHFKDAMRAFVREDPDVVLVGEIRDGETALEALRASQTGHVVLSTLHCNDAVDSVQRLRDLGMHPNSMASELLAVVAQRLAKRVCTHCRVEVPPDPVILAELFPGGPPPEFRTFAGKGCPRCRGRGTHGRVAVIEFLRATEAVRRAIAHGLPVDELRAIARDAGLRTMRTSALRLVTEGIMPLSEVPQVLPLERMADG